MFEREIQFITDFNLNKVKRLGTFFTLTQLKEAGLHPAIFRFISAEIDDYIYLDRKKLLEKSQFDYSGAAIGDYFTKIAEEIKKNKLLPFDSCKRLVHSAVTFNTHFLVNPRLTLSKFIFEDEPNRDIERFRILLNHSYFYDYYREIILRILHKKKSLSVSIEEFKVLIKNIQNELLKTETQEVVENDLVTIAEFFNIGEIRKNRLSCEVVHYYLRGRDMKDELERVRSFLSADLKQKFDIDEYKSVIFSSEPVPYSKEQDTDDMSEIGFSLSESPHDIDARTGQFEIADEVQEATPEIEEEETIRISVESVQELAMASVLSETPELSLEQHTPKREDLPEEELISEKETETESDEVGEEDTYHLQVVNEDEIIPATDSDEVPATDFGSILDELLADDAPITVTAFKPGTETSESPLAPFNFENPQNEDEQTSPEQSTDELVNDISDFSDASPDSQIVDETVIISDTHSIEEEALETEKSDTLQGLGSPLVFSFDTDVLPEISRTHSLKDEQLSGSTESFLLEIPELPGQDVADIHSQTDKEFIPEGSGEDEEKVLSSSISDEMENKYSFSFTPSDNNVSTPSIQNVPEDIETSSAPDEIQEVDSEMNTEETIEEEKLSETTHNFDQTPSLIKSTPVVENTSEDDLLSSFSAKESMTIIKDIFKNNSVDFLETIEKIASCENFMQAQLTLKSVLYAYNINELSETAQLFNRIVTVYFNTKA